MFLTTTQLKAAIAVLDQVRRAGAFCLVARADATGRTGFGEGDRFVAYGSHGSAFLGIDPLTLTVRCEACADGRVTATPKESRAIGGRDHLVSVPPAGRPA